MLDASPSGAVLRAELDAWRETPALDAADARAVRHAESEDRLKYALRSTGRRDDSSLFLHAFAVHVEAPPSRVAERLLEATAERAALDADEAEELSQGAGTSRRMRLAMLRMGEVPFRYDFRWTLVASRRGLEGGAIEVRYDLADDPAPEHVSLFRGIASIEPEGTGSRWTEVLAIGSTVSAPFFLKGKARDEVTKIMTRRMQRLAAGMR